MKKRKAKPRKPRTIYLNIDAPRLNLASAIKLKEWLEKYIAWREYLANE